MALTTLCQPIAPGSWELSEAMERMLIRRLFPDGLKKAPETNVATFSGQAHRDFLCGVQAATIDQAVSRDCAKLLDWLDKGMAVRLSVGEKS